MNRKKQLGLLLIIVVMAGLLAFVQTSAADDMVEPDSDNGQHFGWWGWWSPRVLGPYYAWYGHTYEEWAAAWWQWAYSLPADETHPLIADGEMDCSAGQKGNVWFLGGNFAGSEANRTCEVPAGKALFFPIVNIVCSEWTGDADALGCAESPGVPPGAEFVMNPLLLKIDGKPVGRLKDFLVLSEETFTLGPVPDPAVWGAPPSEATEGATRGYYVLMLPFSKGEHEIEFVGENIVTDSLLDPDDDLDYYYKSEISYKLEVVDDFGEDGGGEAD